MKRALLVPVAVVLAGAAWFLLRATNTKTGEPWSGVLESREIQAGSRVGGRVWEVLVDEGQTVDAGTVLVRFERREWEAERGQLEARRGQALAQAERLAHGFRPEEIAQAEAAVRQSDAAFAALREGARPQEREQAGAEYRAAQAEARNAETTYRRMESLFTSGDLSAQAHDDAKSRRDLAAAKAEASRQRVELLSAGTRAEDLRAAEQRLRQVQAYAEMLRKGSRSEDIAEAKARVAEIGALLEANAIRLDETEVRAPVRARIESISVRPGDLASPGKAVATLLELDQVWARIYVPETELGLIRVGAPVELRTGTRPDRVYAATIEQVNTKAEYLPRNVQTLADRGHLVFGVRLRPAPSNGELKPGMTVFATLANQPR